MVVDLNQASTKVFFTSRRDFWLMLQVPNSNTPDRFLGFVTKPLVLKTLKLWYM